MTRSALSVFLLAFGLTACDSTVPPPDPQPGDPDPPEVASAPLLPASFSDGIVNYATIEEDEFDLVLSGRGEIKWLSSSAARNQQVAFSAYQSGIWLAGVQEGQTRSSIVYWNSGLTTECDDETPRLFALDADTTYTDTEVWPTSLGAPVRADGSPEVYGDQMLWGSYCTRERTFDGPWADRHATPLLDLRVNTAVYRYEREDVAGVRFVRYDVTNTGAMPVSDLRVGYFSDTESPDTYANDDSGGRFTYQSHDAVGYAPDAGMSYVYQLPFQTLGGLTAHSKWVSGYAFLDLPPLSHRILRRYTWQEPEGFGQGPASPTEVVQALDGLSYSGDPMIDPTTDSPSRFAFADDPWAEPSGWVDGRDSTGVFAGFDVRQLLSAGPIDLGAGETRTFTLAWVTNADGATSFDSYQNVLRTLAAVRAEPSLWQFDGDR